MDRFSKSPVPAKWRAAKEMSTRYHLSCSLPVHLAVTGAFTEMVQLNDCVANIIHCYGFPLLLDCRKALRALLTETKVERGDVSQQKWNLC